MFIRKMQMPQQGMPTAEEFALWGARELTYEELLAVNGGKREKSGKSSDGGKSSDSGGGSSKGFFGGGSKKSSGVGTKPKERNKEKKDKANNTQTGSAGREEKKNGSSVSAGEGLKGGEPQSKEEKKNGSTEYTVQKGDTLSGIVRKQYPGAGKEEIVRRVKEAAENSGIKDIDKIEAGQKIIFEKPEPPSERPNEGEKTSPTQGGVSPCGRWGRPSGSGGVSGSTGGSSGNSSGGESSGRGSSSGGGSSVGGGGFNGRINGGADWQEGKNPRMPSGWGTKEKQHTEGQEKGHDAGADFAIPQEKKGFLAGLKEQGGKLKDSFVGTGNNIKNIVNDTAVKLLNKLNEGGNKRIASATTAGYVLDIEAVGRLGHAGWFVSTKKEGSYSFFEVIDLKSTDNNKLKENERKDGRKGTFLSRSPLKFPTPGSAEAKGYGSEAGILKTDFNTKEEMLTYLKSIKGGRGYDVVVEFDISPQQCKTIFDASIEVGERFYGYNVGINSCGITARDVLTVPGSGISKVTGMTPLGLGPYWGMSPNGIGDLLWMRNHGIADRYDIPPISAEGGLK